MLFIKVGLLLAHVVSTAFAWKTFVVLHSDGQDDTPALTAALTNLTSNSTILFQKGITYNIFTPIKFPVLNNVEVSIQGNLTYPSDIATIQGENNLCNYDMHDWPYILPQAVVGSSVSNHFHS